MPETPLLTPPASAKSWPLPISREALSGLLFALGIGIIVGAKLAKGKGEGECAHCAQQAAQARIYETVRAKAPAPWATAPRAPRASAPVYDPADVVSQMGAEAEALAGVDYGYQGGRVGPRKDEPASGGVVIMPDGTTAPFIPPPTDAA
jgi:hypothetical protein